MALKDFLNDVLKTIGRDVNQIQQADAKSYFEQVKSEILTEVAAHPVSQELINHNNPSSFLSGVRGTLFGFIGFESSSQPVSSLLSFLQQNITYTVSKRLLRGIKLTIIIPDYKEMRNEQSLMLPWDSLSWPESIEKGISGLGYYLFSMRGVNSRSKEGTQIRNQLRAAEYKPVKYLSAIFKNAEKKLNRFR